MTETYNADYFLRGREAGVSLYENYRYLPDLTIPMVRAMIAHLGVEKHHRILDFGCARGYTVKAFYELGYDVWGLDCSKWAISESDSGLGIRLQHGKEEELIPGHLFARGYDWIIAKDVLEHVLLVADCITTLMDSARVGVFAVVPLANCDHGKYVVEDYEKDVTHVHRMNLRTWIGWFLRLGWRVEASYRVPGIKDNYWAIVNGRLVPEFRPEWERANGFITARRV